MTNNSFSTPFSLMPLSELQAIHAEIKAEIRKRTKDNEPVLFQMNFQPYNPTRYGSPWLAVVTSWPVGERPTLEFTGQYIGSKGEAGILEAKIMPGSLIKYGQKDYRGKKTLNSFAIVSDDGEAINVDSVRARSYFDEIDIN